MKGSKGGRKGGIGCHLGSGGLTGKVLELAKGRGGGTIDIDS